MARGIHLPPVAGNIQSELLDKNSPNQGTEFTLLVEISSAEEIDGWPDHRDVTADERCYRVHLWVVPENMARTRGVMTWTRPIWKEVFEIPVELESLDYDGTLNIEVERLGWPGLGSDPGTSTGDVVVGRAKVTVPKLGEERGGRFGLVRVERGECRAEGFVFLSMKMVRTPQRRGVRRFYDCISN